MPTSVQAGRSVAAPPPRPMAHNGPVYVVLEGLPHSARLDERALDALAGRASESVFVYFASTREPGTVLYKFRDLRGTPVVARSAALLHFSLELHVHVCAHGSAQVRRRHLRLSVRTSRRPRSR